MNKETIETIIANLAEKGYNIERKGKEKRNFKNS